MNYKASHFLQTNLVNEKSACNDLDATTKVPIRSEMMTNCSESRHSSLGELVTKVGIADASGRKDPLNAAGHPATFIKFIQTVSNLKIQTKLQLRITCSPLGVSLNPLQKSSLIYFVEKHTNNCQIDQISVDIL